ncbi:major facilitator superfamily domain-containing protein [Limtongia smithiae]|uniref:major facilitator superfamily domain-containing protein n=1 Tax=Limtongia smithiae TaxID=1125753 RepID=UPI0034CED4B9
MVEENLSERQKEAEAHLADQSTQLPLSRLLLAVGSMALVLFIAYMDQSGLGVMLPTIGKDLSAQDSVSWASTSTMIANTTFQVLYGRLSDIFGRKYIYLSALLLFFASELLCGFAKTSTQLYVFRGFTGVGMAGINALTMIIVSDVVTLKQRGKYQGILGTAIGLSNTATPFMAAGIVDGTSWRVLFWTIAPSALVCFGIAFPIVPMRRTPGSIREKAKQVDFLGILLSSIALIFLLIPVSSGGTQWAWNSAFIITFFCIGGVAVLVFVYVQWRVSVLPMMPLRLFKDKMNAAMFTQILFNGAVYYAQLTFLPIFYQNARGYSRIVSAALTVPMFASQSIASVNAGLWISRTGYYGRVIITGYVLLTVGTAIQCGIFNSETPAGVMIIPLILGGIGNGFTFQPPLIALQANSLKADRAVIISVRGLVRSLGGAFGLAIASALMSNVLLANIPANIPETLQKEMRKSIYSVPDLSGLTEQQTYDVRHAYMIANRAVLIYYIPLMVIALGLCFFVKDKGLERAEERQAREQADALAALRGGEQEKSGADGGEGKPSDVESAEHEHENDSIPEGMMRSSEDRVGVDTEKEKA